MAFAYTPPGVSVAETVTAQVSPLLAAPAQVCLVGLTQGYQTRTDQFVLSGTSAVALPGKPTGATVTAVVSVKDALDPSKGATDGSGYVVTDDYTASTPSGTITRVSGGDIADGALVNVTYQYIPADYFAPYRMTTLGDVESRYGAGLNTAGTAINCAVSYAASIAFENGADSVVIQPLFVRATPGDPTTAAEQPDATEAAALSSWQDTLVNLRDIDDINVIVPITGQSQANVGDSTLLSIFQAVQDHMAYMKNNYQYMVAILGEDSSSSPSNATSATIRGHGLTLASRYGASLAEQTVLINTSRFTRALPNLGQYITVGGQYMAAAIAGMLASRAVSSPLTRSVVSGFTDVSDRRIESDKNTDAGSGLMVVEFKNNVVRIRHGITLDTSSAARRELSVVRAKHRMIESVRDTLENQIIGKIIADGNSPYIVRSAVTGVLEALRQDRDLVDYSAVDARLLSLDPTTIEVRFSYRPAFPLNYVNVVFSLDLTAANIQVDTSTSGSAS